MGMLLIGREVAQRLLSTKGTVVDMGDDVGAANVVKLCGNFLIAVSLAKTKLIYIYFSSELLGVALIVAVTVGVGTALSKACVLFRKLLLAKCQHS